jgi:hypothetical protein
MLRYNLYQIRYPRTPGSEPSVNGYADCIRDARSHAIVYTASRRDLRYRDVRIERLDGRLQEYAGPLFHLEVVE